MSKIKKKYLDFEIYEQSEVDTISGSLSNEIDSDITTHAAVVAAHHTHLDDEATATASTPTTSASYELMDSMTITPAAGTYRVHFSTSWENTNNGTTSLMAIHYGGTIESSSIRRMVIGGQAQTDRVEVAATTAKVTVNGAQAITLEWNTSNGTTTAYERSLVITRVAS